MDLEATFHRACQLAEAGRHQEAARHYREFLRAVQADGSPVPVSQRPPLIRSAAFNLAQVLNKLGDFAPALECADLGLSCSPTDYGRAIGQAARGEALCGLGRAAEGIAAFEEAARAHPIVGRLNSADSMSRLGTRALVPIAETWLNDVVTDYGRELNEDLQREVRQIRDQIAAARKRP
jgi:tetratricopeptide (TPR) repeat protein